MDECSEHKFPMPPTCPKCVTRTIEYARQRAIEERDAFWKQRMAEAFRILNEETARYENALLERIKQLESQTKEGKQQ